MSPALGARPTVEDQRQEAALVATMRARRGAVPQETAPGEAIITFRLWEVRSALWARLLDEHVALLEAHAGAPCLPSYWATRRHVRELKARMERVLATVPCLETSSLREDFQRLVLERGVR
jgi:hypothetical protein